MEYSASKPESEVINIIYIMWPTVILEITHMGTFDNYNI